MPIEKSAGAIIFKKGKGKILFLLLKHRVGHWSFPKGLLKEREKPEETARREIEEEAGINKFKLVKDFLVWNKFFFKVKYPYQLARGWRKGERVMKIVTYFLAETKTKTVKISYEHDDFGWFSYQEALKKLDYKTDQDNLKKAYQFIIGLNKRD